MNLSFSLLNNLLQKVLSPGSEAKSKLFQDFFIKLSQFSKDLTAPREV